MIKKSVPDYPKLYIFQENNSACVFYLLSSEFYFIGDTIYSDSSKKEIAPLLKVNATLKFSQDAALNNVREKGKPQCKISYRVLKVEYVYDPLLDISPYSTLIQLKDNIDGIHHCVTVVSKWIFDSNFLFALSFTRENLD